MKTTFASLGSEHHEQRIRFLNGRGDETTATITRVTQKPHGYSGKGEHLTEVRVQGDDYAYVMSATREVEILAA